MSQDQSPPRKRIRTVRESSALRNSRVPALRSRTLGSMNDGEASSREALSAAAAAPPKGGGQKCRRARNRKLRRKSSSNSHVNVAEDDGSLNASPGEVHHERNGEGIDLSDISDNLSLVFKTIEKVPGISHLDQEILRIIGQHLENIGLVTTAEMLTKEAGIQLNEPSVAVLKNKIVNADFDGALETLNRLSGLLSRPEKSTMMKFLILEQKYLECLEAGDSLKALMIMQNEILPLGYNVDRVHELTCYLMISDPDELRCKARTTHLRGEEKSPPLPTIERSRLALVERLQGFFPPSVILPPKRLVALLRQASHHQLENCIFHNVPPGFTDFEKSSLAFDHTCSADKIPHETKQILPDHKEEVWCCKFSPDGLQLASSSKNNAVIIWDFNPLIYKLSYNKTIRKDVQHESTYFAWSPCSTKIAVAGSDDNEDVYVFDVASGEIDFRITGQRNDVLSAVAWSPDGKNIIAGGMKGLFYQSDAKGNINESWEGVRVSCLAYRKDNKTVLATDTHYRLRAYNFDEFTDVTIAAEDQSITSFALDNSDTYALLNLKKQGTHLWDIRERCLVRKYTCEGQDCYPMNSCFGGCYQNFVASGSEDCMVYIFHKSKETPISVLSGHTRTVNSVAWNPVFHNVLVSASDDGTLRVWGPAGEAPPFLKDSPMEDLEENSV